MWRYLGSIGMIFVLHAAAVADVPTRLSVIGLPATYTPGGTLTFGVELSGAAGLNAYNVGLTLSSNKGTAGTDFCFDGSPGTHRPLDGGNGYVFDSGQGVSPFGFVATAGTDLVSNMARLSLSDFLEGAEFVSDTGADTLLATATICTMPGAGDLTLGFDSSVLELLTASGQPVPGSRTLVANLDSFNPPTIAQVPEPSSLVLLCPMLGLGGLAMALRQILQNRCGTW